VREAADIRESAWGPGAGFTPRAVRARSGCPAPWPAVSLARSPRPRGAPRWLALPGMGERAVEPGSTRSSSCCPRREVFPPVPADVAVLLGPSFPSRTHVGPRGRVLCGRQYRLFRGDVLLTPARPRAPLLPGGMARRFMPPRAAGAGAGVRAHGAYGIFLSASCPASGGGHAVSPVSRHLTAARAGAVVAASAIFLVRVPGHGGGRLTGRPQAQTAHRITARPRSVKVMRACQVWLCCSRRPHAVTRNAYQMPRPPTTAPARAAVRADDTGERRDPRPDAGRKRPEEMPRPVPRVRLLQRPQRRGRHEPARPSLLEEAAPVGAGVDTPAEEAVLASQHKTPTTGADVSPRWERKARAAPPRRRHGRKDVLDRGQHDEDRVDRGSTAAHPFQKRSATEERLRGRGERARDTAGPRRGTSRSRTYGRWSRSRRLPPGALPDVRRLAHVALAVSSGTRKPRSPAKPQHSRRRTTTASLWRGDPQQVVQNLRSSRGCTWGAARGGSRPAVARPTRGEHFGRPERGKIEHPQSPSGRREVRGPQLLERAGPGDAWSPRDPPPPDCGPQRLGRTRGRVARRLVKYLLAERHPAAERSHAAGMGDENPCPSSTSSHRAGHRHRRLSRPRARIRVRQLGKYTTRGPPFVSRVSGRAGTAPRRQIHSGTKQRTSSGATRVEGSGHEVRGPGLPRNRSDEGDRSQREASPAATARTGGRRRAPCVRAGGERAAAPISFTSDPVSILTGARRLAHRVARAGTGSSYSKSAASESCPPALPACLTGPAAVISPSDNDPLARAQRERAWRGTALADRTPCSGRRSGRSRQWLERFQVDAGIVVERTPGLRMPSGSRAS